MVIPSTVSSTFGFHTNSTVPGNPDPILIEAFNMNARNILGYIPVLGLIPFYSRCVSPMCSDNVSSKPTSVKIAEFVRGLFEGLGLGIIYLIPDLIVTAFRFIPSMFDDRDPPMESV